MMTAAMSASRRLSGTAKKKMPVGSTPRLYVTTHIMTNPVNHERSVVWMTVNFFSMMKMAMANRSDQNTQSAPFTGSDGNIIPILS